MAPPLSLDGYFILESHYSCSRSAADKLASDKFLTINSDYLDVTAIAAHKKDDKTQWKCKLKVSTKPSDQLTCTFSVEIDGYFTVKQEFVDKSLEEANKLVNITGASMLYSAAREHVLTLSSRGITHGVLLPTVTFAPKNEAKDPSVKDRIGPDGKPLGHEPKRTDEESGRIKV